MTDNIPAELKKLEELAASGSSQAFYELGLAYKQGGLVGQDHGKAIRYWKEAARLKNAEALVELGKAFYDGIGTVQDADFAFNCWNDAATLGNVPAMFHLAQLFMDGYRNISGEDETFKWLSKAADAGHQEAPYFLARGHRTGQWGIPVDEAQAAKWSRKVAPQDHLDTIIETAKAYENGTGVLQRKDRAMRWWQIAADAGDSEAQKALGKRHEEKTAEKDVADAQEAPADTYEELGGRNRDIAKILRTDVKAVRGGDGNAMMKLAAMFRAGELVPQNLRYAYALYEAALKKGKGNPKAQEAIDRMMKTLGKKEREKVLDKKVLPLSHVLEKIEELAKDIGSGEKLKLG